MRHVPEPCSVRPEVVTEYPAPLELPEELAERLEDWEDGDYFDGHSIAPGWKIGGWAPWSFSDPVPMNCVSCGSAYQPLLTVASGERDAEEATGPVGLRRPDNAPMVVIGRGDNLQIYSCPESFEHPHCANVQ